MAKYKSIAVIYGSDSSEWEISCRSGEYTASRIDENRYDVYEIFARFGQWNLVAMRKAGAMRTPFPEGARPEVAFDKYSCKSYLRDVDFVKLAPDAFVRRGDDVEAFSKKAVEKLGLPLFVKPTDGGSSFGISKVTKAEDLPTAIRFAFSEGSTVIVEKGITPEHELTCAVYTDAEGVKALPVIEIISDTGWFDYDAKYNGLSREVCPAEIPDALAREIQDITCRIYRHLGCKGLVRMDYISAADGIYFLDVNIIPGMTNASLVPKMVRAAGIDMTAFLTTIIENA